MNKIGSFVFGIVLIALFAGSGDAQRRPAKTTTPKVVTSTATTSATTLKAGSEKVASQIVNISRFLYLLGGAASGIEQVDKDTKANKAARDANAKNKQALIRTIQNLRAGILALEIEFKTKDPMKKHVAIVQGITELAGQSEDLARAGKFTDSGRPLLTVVEKLSDALAAL
jgi:hypothetical protein